MGWVVRGTFNRGGTGDRRDEIVILGVRLISRTCGIFLIMDDVLDIGFGSLFRGRCRYAGCVQAADQGTTHDIDIVFSTQPTEELKTDHQENGTNARASEGTVRTNVPGPREEACFGLVRWNCNIPVDGMDTHMSRSCASSIASRSLV